MNTQTLNLQYENVLIKWLKQSNKRKYFTGKTVTFITQVIKVIKHA